jgi:glutamate racemase
MIGVFDSGSGGLTVLKEIRARMPKADIVYFGDIKNAPYGIRSHEELVSLTTAAIELLRQRGATNIVSACNSVSAALAVANAPEDMIEMIEPTVASFKDSPARILLVATPATVKAEIYQRAFAAIGKEIGTLAIPELAGAIEFGAADEELERIISDAFATVDTSALGTLILGCTHYPFVREIFERVLPNMKVVDPAVAVAERVAIQFAEEGSGHTTFLISQDSEPFRARVANLLPETGYRVEVLP